MRIASASTAVSRDIALELAQLRWLVILEAGELGLEQLATHVADSTAITILMDEEDLVMEDILEEGVGVMDFQEVVVDLRDMVDEAICVLSLPVLHTMTTPSTTTTSIQTSIQNDILTMMHQPSHSTIQSPNSLNRHLTHPLNIPAMLALPLEAREKPNLCSLSRSEG